MTPTERVKAALAHRKADRIPQYEIFFPEFNRRWQRELNLTADATPYKHYRNIDIGIDSVLATQCGPLTAQASKTDAGEYILERDSWGRLLRHSKTGKLFEVLETTIKDKADLDRIPFENAADPAREDIKGIAAATQAATGRFAPISGVLGLFMSCYYLRGEVTFMMDLMDDPAFCDALVGKMADYVSVLGARAMQASDTFDTALWVYDDFGCNKGPLIAPALFERHFVPAYKRMIAYWKSLGLKNVIIHHDGNSWEILDLLIEAGFTGVQGIYPAAHMTIPAVKAKYGSRLALVGGVCNMSVLATGSKRDIEHNVASIFEVAKDGGVIIGAHSIEEDVPPANYDHYYQTVAKLNKRW